MYLKLIFNLKQGQNTETHTECSVVPVHVNKLILVHSSALIMRKNGV